MVYRNNRIIAVTPAGRRRYLKFLIPHLKDYHNAGILDEYHLWVNTTNIEDIAYMEEVATANPQFIKLVRLPDGVRVQGTISICHFFQQAQDENTVYVRFDDDIILIDTVDAFKTFLDFRIDNPCYFLVYANIINNSICAHILQRLNILNDKAGFAGYACMDNIGWSTGSFAANIHDQVIEAMNSGKGLSHFKYNNVWCLYNNERVSINCISWLGNDFKKWCGGKIGADEEEELASSIPRRLGLRNIIFGGYCVLHYAFGTQRNYLDELDYYNKITKCISLL